MTLTIINARVVGMSGLQAIEIDDHQGAGVPIPITALDQLPEAAIDVTGDWIAPGGLDLQINGALGLAFPELQMSDLDQLDRICRTLWEAGVDGFAPTIVTTSIANIQRSLGVIAAFQAQRAAAPPTPAAQIIGVHLEGPCLNPAKRGAHPQDFLLPLTLDQLDRILGDHADQVKIVTLAPELDPSGATIAALRDRGIIVSLGHSLATADQARHAFDQGATMVTHAFNAMPGLHHRDPGLLGAAIVDSRVYSGVIADGQHVCPTMLNILLNADRSNLFLVSDALSPLGLPDGVYPWDEREIVVTQGTARLRDGTLSGTTRPLLDGADNLVNWGLCDLERAIDLVSHAPRRAIGLPAWDTTAGSAYRLSRWSQTEDGQITRSRPVPIGSQV
ncbi:MAG: N-acetylglucosamine-6-phosphate deacetylase [Oscillatoriales cyanobacterium]|nr:MAG: N-acetylglucosamine-6-phosphate deacetylase [Oscillatoriales cyanobacterium]